MTMEAIGTQAAFIGLTFLLAGFVKGVVGLGLPTVAVGLLGLVMPPAQAAALLVAPSMVTNLVQLVSGPRFGQLVLRLWPMLAAICAGTWLCAALVPAGMMTHATSALGVALVLYAMVGLAAVKLHVPPAAEAWLGPVVGLVTGAITAVTGVFVIPAVPYLQGLGLEKESLVQALGLSFTISTIALAVSLALGGSLLHTPVLGASLLALVPALGGMFIGQWLRHRISAERFRKVFFCGLLVLGGELAMRGLS
ncbi:sulfite exporter TauE/SafE family protein [Cupriavidus oxalaticus]|uniref:Probable membrane transporter protein n=1 Tax=Cupriavidus oxalaticus TaxID=96344 RepID=A0A976GD11_9BURK|nr:sulfite exporter TauE/SafE family protein [Cupriavidus oxalaticus]QRQ84663.1 sulfite exporter TauE/SafE family protein [Cupriavidus oxalaticus]QRQ91248.1 sulfite exporter TauE/SafE family protein [Cupriavidus oxalaticus]WQD85806.1 sulfite exporter TauE/SafE family protein [Cupriavidus oxalaticus]SPC20672.1 Membrane protein [Cupriavidus oxalaticus]